MRQLVYQVCYARCQVSFYLWWVRPKRNYIKVLKYDGADHLKIFFDSLPYQWSYNILEKVPIWLQNISSFRKQLSSKIESFLNANFDLNQGYKIVLTQNH